MCFNFDSDACLVDFSNIRQKKTQRRRACHECGQWVPPGETFWENVIKWDGGFQAFFHCLWCNVRANYLNRNCNGFVFGSVVPDFESHFSDRAASVRFILGELGQLLG